MAASVEMLTWRSVSLALLINLLSHRKVTVILHLREKSGSDLDTEALPHLPQPSCQSSQKRPKTGKI